jgi:predicted acetyltransferase
MPEYGALSERSLEQLQAFDQYAFHVEDGPVTSDPRPLEDYLGDQRGVFEDGELVSVGTLVEFDARFRGTWITLGGLRGVSTPPEHRRRGYVRHLARESLAEFRDRSVPLVALWPFETSFYRKLGWGTCQKYVRYDFPPRALAAVGERGGGDYRRVGEDDWETVADAHCAAGEGTTLSLRLTEGWWRRRFDGKSPYCYVYERDGDVVGYVMYTVEADSGEYEMCIWDLSATDAESERALYWLVATHDSQVQTVRHYRTDDALLDRVDDPSAFETSVGMGPMVRIPDVPTALEALPAPDREGVVVIEVRDRLADWNDGRFAVETSGDGVACERIADDRSPDASVGIATLSQLVVGYHDTAAAERVGSLSVDDEGAQAVLDELFTPERVALREFF